MFQFQDISIKRKLRLIIMVASTVALLALSAFASVSRAALYVISFNDGNGNVGSGQIDVESASGNSYAASGSLDVTAGQALGNWTLYVDKGNTTFPDSLLSPRNAFIYNNAVYPTGQNPQYGDGGPLLDVYGLLFTQNNGNEVNLWGNTDGAYTLGSNIGGQTVTVDINFGGTTITSVPEPVNCALAGFGLIFVGVSVGRFYLGRRRSAVAS
jgi:hypothetical protein